MALRNEEKQAKAERRQRLKQQKEEKGSEN